MATKTSKQHWADRIRQIIGDAKHKVSNENKTLQHELNVKAYDSVLRNMGIEKEVKEWTVLEKKVNEVKKTIMKKTGQTYYSPTSVGHDQHRALYSELLAKTPVGKTLAALDVLQTEFLDKLYLCKTQDQIADLLTEVSSTEVKVPAARTKTIKVATKAVRTTENDIAEEDFVQKLSSM